MLKKEYILRIFLVGNESHKTEQNVTCQENIAQSYINLVGNIVLVLDEQFKISFLNKKGYKILGYKEGELQGKTWETCLPAELRKEIHNRFNDWMQGKTKPMASHENDVITRSGERRTIYWYNTDLKDEKGNLIGTLSSGEDITERKKAEEALKQAQAKLQDYAKNLERLVEERTKQLQEKERMATIGQTAGMVGHDIRNPLQAIMGDLFLIEQTVNATPKCKSEDIADSLASINDNIDYINKIVSDLQDYTRPLKPMITLVNIKQSINKILNVKRISRNLTKQIEVEDNLTLKTDATYFRRIIENLTNNALQAMPQGGKLTIEAFQGQNNMTVIIQDTGMGIKESDKANLFKPLFTTKAKGQGLGLAVVKRLVEALNGTIVFESQEGKGAKFIIHLPLS